MTGIRLFLFISEVAYGSTIPTYITSTIGLLVPYVHTVDSTRPVLHTCNILDAPGYVNLAKIQDNFAGINCGCQIYAQIHALSPNMLIMGTENDPYTDSLSPTQNSPTWFWW